MFFPITLKNAIPVEEFVEKMNQAGLSGGRVRYVTTDTPFAPAYIVFEACEDPRCAVSVAIANKKTSDVRVVKAQLVDISSLENRLADSAVAGAIRGAGGLVGSAIANHASGFAKKQKDAKRLVKTTNKELKPALEKLGW